MQALFSISHGLTGIGVGESEVITLGHTALSNVPKGKPRSEHGDILEVAEKLRRFGFITTFPSTREMHVCASRADKMITEGLVVVNEYRPKVGLPALRRDQM